ncbi:unnamed protein product [Notodromas monacha]|uniref:All-trans-retinol 13,14-reductase n=1 Tax=Notodromas monacha TaxID=399045 RepID=A0A7R9BZ53_9CRUS|nr:unnamed protein product [Notodromas monacha]CAG0922797.1 unnamed protein product [Notodromas monacha]
MTVSNMEESVKEEIQSCLCYTISVVITSVLIAIVTFKILVEFIKFLWPNLSFLFPHHHHVILDTRNLDPVPPVHDKEKRAKILKNDFSREKIPSDLDAILIGSGLGCLSTAVFLTRAGKKVLVLEQNAQAGGCLGTLNYNGYDFNLGLHLVTKAAVTPNISSRDIFDQLTAGAVEFHALDDKCTMLDTGAENGQLYSVNCKDFGTWGRHLMETFPQDKEAIQKYVDACWRILFGVFPVLLVKVLPYKLAKFLINWQVFDYVSNYQKWNHTSVRQFMDNYTGNEDLKRMITLLTGYFFPDPQPISMALLAPTQIVFASGYVYPYGGPEEIPYHAISQIQKSGSQVLVNARVTSILLDDAQKTAIGVVVKPKSGCQISIKAPLIISSTGVWNTYKSLLPESVVQAHPIMRDALASTSPPADSSAFFVFLAIHGTTEEMKLPQADYFFMKGPGDYEERYREYLNTPRDVILDDTESQERFEWTFLEFPTVRDPHAKIKYPGKSLCIAFGMVAWSWFAEWDTLSDSELDADAKHTEIENRFGERIYSSVLQRFPQLKGRVDYIKYTSPCRLAKHLNSHSGKLMGLDLNTQRMSLAAQAALRPETGLKGLYITGQDVVASGTQLAALGGMLTASKILGRNLVLEMEIQQRCSTATHKKHI